MKKIHLLSILLFVISIISCQKKLSEEPDIDISIDTPTDSLDAPVDTLTDAPVDTLVEITKGRIGIRLDSGSLKFFDKGSNIRLTPMGYNYTHLEDFSYNGITLKGHTTFIEGYYDANASEDMLAKLETGGYNTVRIFLNPASISFQKGVLDQSYIANISDFIKKADEHNLSVIITTDLIPLSYYEKELATEEDLTWLSTQYILQEDINLEMDFWKTLIDEFQNNAVPLKAILSYQLRNEFFFHPERTPFAENTGIVAHPNGKSYDMSIESERNELMDVSFIHWSTSVRNVIQEKDPEALVSVGFFAPGLVGKPSKIAISQSELDFIDVHMYPEKAKINEYADYFDLINYQDKLIIMGEFGYVENPGQSIEEIKDNLLDWKNTAVSDYHLDGWLLWTWGTGVGVELSVRDENDVIFNAFSPK
jgi:hypothetical protein